MKRPPMKARQDIADLCGKDIKEPYYSSAMDALSYLDLAPQAIGVPPDPIQVFAAKTLAWGHAMATGDTQRAHRQVITPLPTVEDPAYEKRIPGANRSKKRIAGRYYAPLLSRKAEIFFTRLVLAVVAGLLLLVPMIVLSFVKKDIIRLVLTSVFVLVFAVTVSFASTGSNHEVMIATATYAAVLSVFVGQTDDQDAFQGAP
jgi:hypothetical protein